MSQQTIYLDSTTEQRAKDAARAAGLPVSRWIAVVIKQRTETEWPPSIAEMAGAWNDFPSLPQLRKTNAKDVRREKF